MIILGIESTCDETAASLVEDGRHLLSNIEASPAAYDNMIVVGTRGKRIYGIKLK